MERAMGIEPTSEAWDIRPHGSSILLSRLRRFAGNASRINLPPVPRVTQLSQCGNQWRGCNERTGPPDHRNCLHNLFVHNHIVAQKFTGKQIKWEVVTRPAAGGRGGDDFTGGGVGDVSLAVHAGRGYESLPLRIFWRSDAGMPLHAADDPALCFENLRAAAGPH